MNDNIHASCVELNHKGILILGDSGSGKSDLCLRLIFYHQAKLVADDRVNIKIESNYINAQAPKNLQGLLEIRGIGISKFDFLEQTTINLVIKLTNKPLERMPQKSSINILGKMLPLIKINPFELSAPCKIIIALRSLC